MGIIMVVVAVLLIHMDSTREGSMKPINNLRIRTLSLKDSIEKYLCYVKRTSTIQVSLIHLPQDKMAASLADDTFQMHAFNEVI